MKTTFYRLGEHKIIQAGGALWWEAHTGVGAFKTGRCFVRGNILLLGPCERGEPGYLKREFLESLQPLPQWDHTRYYCSTYSMNECRSGRTLREEEVFEWAGSQTKKIQGFDKMEPGTSAPASYRLGQHEITQKDGQWRWRTYSGSGRIREGRCIVEGGVLFLETGQTEESGDLKHAFIKRLKQLPEWRATTLYSPRCAVYDCKTGENLIQEEGIHLTNQSSRIPNAGVFTPGGRDISSPMPPLETRRPPGIDSTLSLLGGIAGKAGIAVKREIRDVFLRFRLNVNKHKISCATEVRETRVHRSQLKKWVAWSGAVFLMIGLSLLLLVHDLWESRKYLERHHHSAGRNPEH